MSTPGAISIRDAVPEDWPAMWPFMREIVATIPEGFHHPADGFVGLHIMYRRLAVA